MRQVINMYKLPQDDVELFDKMRTNSQSENERVFFERMMHKEMNEHPVMVFDVLMDPKDNSDQLYFVKQYSSEYEIGLRDKFQEGFARLDVMPTSLSEALSCDLYDLIGRHILLLEWLRERDYRGVNYDYPWEE